MKIGIVTFHWATNYGAVLQAYALSSYLNSLGNETEIIDYYPLKYKKNIISAFMTRHLQAIPRRIKEIGKEKKIEEFRKRNLKRTKYYSSENQLKMKAPVYDCYICGSDQIWNMSFLRYGERKKTYVYFLSFAPADKILASYAASFGTTAYAEDLKKDIINKLQRFDFISVREATGLKIVKDLGFSNACVVPDPTLLLKKEDYKKFIRNSRIKHKYAYAYMLHGKDKDADDVFTYLKNNNISVIPCDNGGVENWLTDIYYSELVVTNSFHGVVFSILFERPFVAVLIKDSGMNDRIITLLDKLGLLDRIFDGNLKIIDKPIDWEMVSEHLSDYRSIGCNYINRILSYKKG